MKQICALAATVALLSQGLAQAESSSLELALQRPVTYEEWGLFHAHQQLRKFVSEFATIFRTTSPDGFQIQWVDSSSLSGASTGSLCTNGIKKIRNAFMVDDQGTTLGSGSMFGRQFGPGGSLIGKEVDRATAVVYAFELKGKHVRCSVGLIQPMTEMKVEVME